MSKRIFLFALAVCFFALAPRARAQFTVDAYITAPSGSGPLTGTCANEQWENPFFSGVFDYPADEYLYSGQSVYECELLGPNGLEDECVSATNVNDTDEAECTVSTADNPASGTYQVLGVYAAQPWYDSDEIFCGPDSPYLDPLDLEDTDPPSFNGAGSVLGNGQGLNCTGLSSIIAAYSQETYTLNQVAVTISPTAASVTAGGQPVTFSANVTNAANTAVTWSSNTDGTGTFTPNGSNGSSASYTPPAYIASQASFQVTATSVQDPLQSATAALTVNPLIPTITSVNPPSWNAGASFPLTINGTGFTSSTQVQINSTNWPISPSNYSCSPPTTSTSISCNLSVQANLAPASSGGATITVSDGSFSATYPASGTIPIVPIVYTYTVTLAVPSPSLTYGYSTSITPTVTCKTSAGSCASNVSNPQEALFALTSGPGSLTGTGLQTATTFVASTMVAYPSQNSSVQACAPLQTASCASTNISTSGITISLNPSSLQNPLTSGATQTFSASVQNPGTATTNALTWTLSPRVGTLTSATTSISGSPTSGTSSNTYHASSSVNPVTLSACMTANTSICATPVSIPLNFLPAPGDINTIAGNGTEGYSGDGGPATSAELYWAAGVTVDSAGNIYIADSHNQRIRKVTASTGAISTVAGDGTAGYNGDRMPATSAELNYPTAAALDSAGNIYIADENNQRIRVIYQGGAAVASLIQLENPGVTPVAGDIYTIAGNGSYCYNGDGTLATSAHLCYPTGVASDSAGNVYIADSRSQRVREVTASTGIISTVAGTGTAGYNGDELSATSAELYDPACIAVDSAGNIYVTDYENQRVRVIYEGGAVLASLIRLEYPSVTPVAGDIYTIAGNGTASYSGDGGPAINAELDYPVAIAVDSAGNVYIPDSGNNRVRKVTASTGYISTVAGNGTAGYSGDGGAATSAELNGLYGAAVDSAGNIYVADEGNNVIRAVGAP